MLGTLKRLVTEEEGQGMVEYALIVAAIAAVAGVVFVTLGDKIKALFNGITL